MCYGNLYCHPGHCFWHSGHHRLGGAGTAGTPVELVGPADSVYLVILHLLFNFPHIIFDLLGFFLILVAKGFVILGEAAVNLTIKELTGSSLVLTADVVKYLPSEVARLLANYSILIVISCAK